MVWKRDGFLACAGGHEKSSFAACTGIGAQYGARIAVRCRQSNRPARNRPARCVAGGPHPIVRPGGTVPVTFADLRQPAARRLSRRLYSGPHIGRHGRPAFGIDQHRLSRPRLRDGALPDFGRAVGDDGPDGLRQSRPRRVRDGGRLRHDIADECVESAVPARARCRRGRGRDREHSDRTVAVPPALWRRRARPGPDDHGHRLHVDGGVEVFFGPLSQPMRLPPCSAARSISASASFQRTGPS